MKKVLVVLTALAAFPALSWADGMRENKPWQFQDSNSRHVDILREQLRQKKAGGYYEQWNVNQDFVCQEGSTCKQYGAGAVGTSNTAIGNYTSNKTTVEGDNNKVESRASPDQDVTESDVSASTNTVGETLNAEGTGYTIGETLDAN